MRYTNGGYFRDDISIAKPWCEWLGFMIEGAAVCDVGVELRSDSLSTGRS